MPPGPKRPPVESDDFYEENFDMEQMERECEQMLQIHHLNRENCTLRETQGGFLSLTFDGRTYESVDVIRTFPFTAPEELLSVRETQGKKREIGVIRNLEQDFDEPAREAILKQLELRYYMPVITRVLQVKERNGIANFRVDTDKGELSFSIQSTGNHFTHLTDARILITDLEGNRYEIPNVNALSAREQKRLDLYL